MKFPSFSIIFNVVNMNQKIKKLNCGGGFLVFCKPNCAYLSSFLSVLSVPFIELLVLLEFDFVFVSLDTACVANSSSNINVPFLNLFNSSSISV